MLGGGAGGGLERIGGVGEYEVDAVGHEAVYYSGAAGLLSERVALRKRDAVLAENLDERVLKAARGLAEGDVFHLFADADGIAVNGVVAASLVGCAAGGKRERQTGRKSGGEQFLVHFGFLHVCFCWILKKA